MSAPKPRRVALGFDFSQGRVEASAGFEETAGGAYVVALADGALAARLGGRDSEVEVERRRPAGGHLSLSGSTGRCAARWRIAAVPTRF